MYLFCVSWFEMEKQMASFHLNCSSLNQNHYQPLQVWLTQLELSPMRKFVVLSYSFDKVLISILSEPSPVYVFTVLWLHSSWLLSLPQQQLLLEATVSQTVQCPCRMQMVLSALTLCGHHAKSVSHLVLISVLLTPTRPFCNFSCMITSYCLW